MFMNCIFKTYNWQAFLLWGCLFCFAPVSSQNYHVYEELKATPSKLGGVESPYRFEKFNNTPAPKGYKPFYIGHYGRHGSRYGWNTKVYTLPKDVFSKAEAEGMLTEKGKLFWERYKKFYEIPLINMGDLTDMGWEQHSRIAREFFNDYPDVFQGKAKIRAMASTSGRAIVSMGAFLSALKGENPKLDVQGNSLHTNTPYTMTKYAHPSVKKSYMDSKLYVPKEKPEDFARRTINYEELTSVLFKDADYLRKCKLSRMEFYYHFIDFIFGYKNHEDKPLFDEFYTPEQLIPLWEAKNYYIFRAHNDVVWQHVPLLQNIVEKCDAAINGGDVAMDLRFGHDHVFQPLMALMNVNGERTPVTKAEDVKLWYQDYNTPMAATFAIVLFKNKRGDVIFKAIRNGEEVKFPQIKPVTGPYYNWSDFRRWANKIFEDHPVKN